MWEREKKFNKKYRRHIPLLVLYEPDGHCSMDLRFGHLYPAEQTWQDVAKPVE